MGGDAPAPRWRTANFENVLGTSMQLKLSADSQSAADSAEAATMAEIRRLNGVFSGYDRASEFSRWSAAQGQPVRVSHDLMEVLSLWDTWRGRTDGALNPSAEAITRVWKNAEATHRLPAEPELRAAVAAAGEPQWQLDRASGLATRLNSAPVVLNSFTKSYIIERAADAAMRVTGVAGVEVNIGGDLVVRGPVADRIGVANPFSDAENEAPIAMLNVKDRAVATSGNYRRGFDIAGVHYSHIVDPRTGRTADEVVSATVVAPKAVDAGALATALCVESTDGSRKLAATVPGAEYLIVRKDGTRIASAGWNSLQAPGARPLAMAAPRPSVPEVWNPAYELTIGVEIPQVQGFGARRPYVAVWIEDKNRFPVRTLALWFNNPRWLPDLRGWYRSDRLRSMSEGTEILNSVTSATRSPGKYTFKWDGKDNTGKPVKPGMYTVLIEAAREHGGYSLVRREMNLSGQPLQAQAPPEGELGAISIDYHKAAR